ncbi:hypothetical protein [Acidithiobacillus ferrivorans]|uniref:hypothetical protein n=1 Tax=Acidithiobacillus ferrivorans TaxID=160808 RepID=UPI0012E040B3|nr:hypothetical protein [Acidithiobacillus ferrivorans]
MIDPIAAGRALFPGPWSRRCCTAPSRWNMAPPSALRASGDGPTAANTDIPDPNILQALRRSVKIMQSHLVSLQI